MQSKPRATESSAWLLAHLPAPGTELFLLTFLAIVFAELVDGGGGGRDGTHFLCAPASVPCAGSSAL